ncbi:hypothetical protein PAXINDRAFT_9039 [Paxillus involutus ATCC 200175]|nr:hypothetical protein PAXINDRAFT_9039 [Paxillus involutus ATCC 200175]
MVSVAAADTVNPNTISARPTEPAGGPHIPQKSQKGGGPARKTAKGAAAVTGPGEGAMGQRTDGVSLAATTSSQDNNSRDPGGVRCTHTNSQNPNKTRHQARNAAADPATPNAKRAEPPEPAGAPRKPQNALHKSHEGKHPGASQ